MVAPRKTLLPTHYHLYRQEPYGHNHDNLTLSDIAGRLAVVLGIVVGATLLGAVLPTRYHPATSEAKWISSFIIGLLLAGRYFYTAVWRPLLGRVPAYRWVGEFAVREKYSVFGTKLLRLAPGDNQTIRVENQLFALINEGDQVRVIYSADGELVSVGKMAGLGRK